MGLMIESWRCVEYGEDEREEDGSVQNKSKKKLLTDNTDRHFFWPLGFGKRNLFLHPQVKMSCFHYLLVLLQW